MKEKILIDVISRECRLVIKGKIYTGAYKWVVRLWVSRKGVYAVDTVLLSCDNNLSWYRIAVSVNKDVCRMPRISLAIKLK